MRSNLVDLKLRLHHRTDKAVLVSDTDEKDDAIWLPLSQVEVEEQGAYATITMPEWLAIDKGFV